MVIQMDNIILNKAVFEDWIKRMTVLKTKTGGYAWHIIKRMKAEMEHIVENGIYEPIKEDLGELPKKEEKPAKTKKKAAKKVEKAE